MGKHVLGSNLFPTVRARRPTKQRVYPSTERVCLPTDLSTERRRRVQRVYLSTIDRPTDQPTDRTSTDAGTVLLPE